MTAPASTTPLRRDRSTATVAAIAYVALGWCCRNPPRGLERHVFARFNHHSDDITVLRVPQQFGTPRFSQQAQRPPSGSLAHASRWLPDVTYQQ
jgi:hypothetical protein